MSNTSAVRGKRASETTVPGGIGSAVNAAIVGGKRGIDLLHRLHKLVHERVQLLSRGPMPPQPEVERVVEVSLVIGASI